MTAPSSEHVATKLAHSCNICDQLVIDLNQSNHRHVLGQLDELLGRPSGENCELLRQHTAKRNAGPETGVELGDYRIYAAIDDPAPAAVPFRPPGIGFGSETACKVARG
ncbi:hypothetical protein PFICI_03880 [Pestalotiopsis fici W106-1]|uniref:Uncharacterized protein n=1 Tax=Pestalotiopsis fici (strain W106-1 / CGMCC3.15140) TaxID=1229662 RepID=W3XIK7_PESFW|nr:uncharacterized protein PFICI_03880 [Pestalotiopsis fici W106-1]ETS85855.1 hypothetical protein PFICI_03880 [Pestalotiopsis fici W106-1]